MEIKVFYLFENDKTKKEENKTRGMINNLN